MATSQNGYPANDRALVTSWTIPGTNVHLTLKRGACGYVLTHFAARFDKVIEDIDNARGALDDWGYAERPIRGSATELSNHASGTAMDLNATRHPLGKADTFTKVQAANIRALLQQYDGVIRWGGDYTRRPDEMHFEIDKPLADVSRVAARLRQEEERLMVTPEDEQKIAAIVAEALEPIHKELADIKAWAKSARAQALAAHTEGIEANEKLDAHLAEE